MSLTLCTSFSHAILVLRVSCVFCAFHGFCVLLIFHLFHVLMSYMYSCVSRLSSFLCLVCLIGNLCGFLGLHILPIYKKQRHLFKPNAMWHHVHGWTVNTSATKLLILHIDAPMQSMIEIRRIGSQLWNNQQPTYIIYISIPQKHSHVGVLLVVCMSQLKKPLIGI